MRRYFNSRAASRISPFLSLISTRCSPLQSTSCISSETVCSPSPARRSTHVRNTSVCSSEKRVQSYHATPTPAHSSPSPETDGVSTENGRGEYPFRSRARCRRIDRPPGIRPGLAGHWGALASAVGQLLQQCPKSFLQTLVHKRTLFNFLIDPTPWRLPRSNGAPPARRAFPLRHSAPWVDLTGTSLCQTLEPSKRGRCDRAR